MTKPLLFPTSPLIFPQVDRTGPASLRRMVTVQPGMCGPTQSLVACVGDWTWETVSAVCGLDVFNAQDTRGTPVYLAFYYYRITSGSDFHPSRLTFGDRLEVHSQAFDAGQRSVLTVHRLRRISSAEAATDAPFDATEVYTRPRADCLYFENLNVWVSRGNDHSNVGLLRSPPVGFDHSRLPKIPAHHSPRALCVRARAEGAFPDPSAGLWPLSSPDLFVDHPVDPIRDVNGVGLLYFASFFSIAENVQLHRWRSLGRSNRSFLARTLRDARISYLGNADLDATLRVRLRASHDPDNPAHEKADILVRDMDTDRTIAIAAFRYSSVDH